MTPVPLKPRTRLLNETLHLVYEVTISPPYRNEWEKLHVKNPNALMYQSDKVRLRHWCKVAGIKRYVFYPEFSDKGRLHYHGMMRFTPSQQHTFFTSLQFKFKMLGLLQYKPLATFGDLIKWSIYMRKDWGFTSVDLNEYLPITSWQPKALYKKYAPPEGGSWGPRPPVSASDSNGPNDSGPERPEGTEVPVVLGLYYNEYYEDWK